VEKNTGAVPNNQTNLPSATDLPDLSVADEKFLNGLLSGLNASDALRQSRDTSAWTTGSIWATASTLRSEARFKPWLAVAKAAGVAKAIYTYTQYLDDLDYAANRADKLEQISALVAARKEMGIASGHRVEKREVLERKSLTDAKGEIAKLFKEAQDMGLIAPGDNAKVIEGKPQKK